MLDDRKGEEMNKEIELIKNIIKTREELKNNNTQGLLDKIIMAKKKINKDECNRCLKAI